MKDWWKTGVIYQIYPRSFMDSNGDGIGDLAGIIQKIPYLKELGIDALWLSPFYPSPMKDFGYDISNYEDVDPIFGEMKDFDRLLDLAHENDIRIVIDLVVNHTSDQHPWFIESCFSRDSKKRDWYIWHPGIKGHPPTNWRACFDLKNAWRMDDSTKEYYYGSFTKHQPELNWKNPEVRTAVYDMIKRWLDKGVDGFRLDVVNWYIKDDQWRNNPLGGSIAPDLLQRHIYDRNRPETHEICRELRALTNLYPDRMMVGEIAGINDSKEAASYLGQDDELHMAFNFSFLLNPWSAKAFYNTIKQTNNSLPPQGWPNYTLSNHDQPRHYSRYGKGPIGEARARVAAAMMLSLKGTPFLYYGEEIGMINGRLSRRDLKDPLGIKTWPLRSYGRDPERTPMQWTDGPSGGFTQGKPWLPVNGDYPQKNVNSQLASPDSLLQFYKSLLRLRRNHKALNQGEIQLPEKARTDILWYSRYDQSSEIRIYLNFKGKTVSCPLPKDLEIWKIIFSSKKRSILTEGLSLAPYEILFIEMEK